jgi:HemY protein
VRLLVFVIALLFVSVSVTLFAMHNPGYVLIARAPWSVEMPLTLFALLLVGAVALLYFLSHLVVRLWNIPRDVSHWREERQRAQAQEALLEGLVHLAEGNPVQAEKRLLSELRHTPSPLVNYLGAAYAAQAQGDSEKRNEYLALAQQNSAAHSLAVSMAQAQLQYAAGQYEQALAILTQLRTAAPGHAPALRLLAAIYRELRDWTGLASLISELRRRSALPAAEIDALELLAHRELLTLSLPSGSRDILEKAWNTVPKHLRSHPALIAIYAEHLMKQREMDKAEILLKNALSNEWDEKLVRLYGQVHSSKPELQLSAAESWVGTHPHDAALLLTLGRLAIQSQQRAKAQDYLERASALGDLPEAYTELGALLEQSGQADKARECYRRGLTVRAEKRSEVPRKLSGTPAL